MSDSIFLGDGVGGASRGRGEGNRGTWAAARSDLIRVTGGTGPLVPPRRSCPLTPA